MPKPKGENSKKAAGNARKAEAAASKQAKVEAVKSAKVDAEWADGAKDTSKKAAAEAKKREAAEKKAIRDAELAAENASLKTAKVNPKAGSKGKTPAAPSRGLDAALSAFDSPAGSSGATTLNASGIDNALDALSLTTGASSSVDRHPERRFKAAFAAYEERRIAEGKADGSWSGLRMNQVKERIFKEFEKSEENPFNQGGNVRFDASKEEVKAVKQQEKNAIENRLGDRS